MSRPAGAPRQYATNEKFADAPYTAIDCKLEPSLGEKAAGLYQPVQSLPSNWANFRDNDVGRRLLDLDALEIMNWPLPGNGDGSCAAGGNSTTDLSAKLWDPRRPLIFVSNDEDLMISLNDGVTWASDLNSPGAVFTGLAQAPLCNAAIYEVAGAGRIYCQGSAGTTWTSQALTSCTQANAITFDSDENCFWVVGEHSSSGGIWRLTNANGSMPMTLNTVDTGETPVFYLIAAGPDWKLAANDTEFWRWPPSVAGVFTPVKQTSPLTGPMGGANAQELRYMPADDLMVLMAKDGSTTFILVSADGGNTWVDKSANLPADFVLLSRNNTSAVRGSIFAVAGELDGQPGILWTGDACESFSFVPDPMARHTTLTPDPTINIVRVTDRRWACAGYVAAGSHAFAYGLRMGA